MKLPATVVRALERVVTPVATKLLGGESSERRNAVWRALAQRRGGRCNEPRGRVTAVTPPESIDLRVGWAEVRLDLTKEELGNSVARVTRARSHYVLRSGPAFEVSPAGIMSGLGRSLGLEDLQLGDGSFDEAFVVRGRDHAGIKAVWPVALQQRLLERLPGATVWSDGTQVRLTVPGALEDEARVDTVLDVVGALASVGAAEFQALAQLPEATLTPGSGTWDNPSAPQLSLATAHGEAVATLHWVKSGPRIWLSLPTTRDLPPFRVVVRNGAVDGLPSGLLSEYTLRLLSELDGVLLLSEPGKLDVRWLGIPTPDGLMAGAKLLGELAGSTHHVGAFR